MLTRGRCVWSLPWPFPQSCRWAPGCLGWSCRLSPTCRNPKQGKLYQQNLCGWQKLNWMHKMYEHPSHRLLLNMQIFVKWVHSVKIWEYLWEYLVVKRFCVHVRNLKGNCFILKQVDFTHRHFISSLDVEHHVLNKGNLVQVWDDPKTWAIRHTQGPTNTQFPFLVQPTFAGNRVSCCTSM